MNEQQLQELALQAQQHPLGTTARRITLSKLIDGIYRSGKLCHPYNGQFQGVYEQIYQEAVQDLFLYICKNIDKYDPERALFMTWVNMLLSQRFFKEAIPKIIGKVHEINVESSVLENLEDLVFDDSENEDNYIFAFKKIRRYIEIDPKGIFKQAHIKKYPQVNFQEIAVKRWSGISWKDISEELNIPVATLSNFYQRTLEKFRDEFRDLYGGEDLT
ncbi:MULTISPECIES: sigma-70 family RNA polymerase sigma factor [Nostoc]|uniref:Sigma-70 family RNA polymerase sigma factor n=1 Tax=Nostoc paludosum FACHB-159 TaxID=2692908 RepID=A0ABR8KIH6_9NOSO|nr:MULTISPECIES: sigma-70 family RNA polymerase sigma factor [Nostoc]MBD2681532.1 sigma-70 family RNA polymerase sigma factor [Nostoc sp. FACHB-857]MBD2737993.1 sigma-70 family RNA polymerase sigma factor [Nostoc paludosum FACHB-159]